MVRNLLPGREPAVAASGEGLDDTLEALEATVGEGQLSNGLCRGRGKERKEERAEKGTKEDGEERTQGRGESTHPGRPIQRP